MNLIHFYRTPIFSESEHHALLTSVQSRVSGNISNIQTEHCFNIAVEKALTPNEIKMLIWLLSETFEPANFSDKSFLQGSDNAAIIEVGPRMNFSTAWSTNAVSICHACGLKNISRIERSRRYRFLFSKGV